MFGHIHSIYVYDFIKSSQGTLIIPILQMRTSGTEGVNKLPKSTRTHVFNHHAKVRRADWILVIIYMKTLYSLIYSFSHYSFILLGQNIFLRVLLCARY